MRTDLRWELGDGYRSTSQAARVVTQEWVEREVECLECQEGTLAATAQNTPALDFRCDACRAPYELKSSRGPLGPRIVDGSYSKLVSALESDDAPNFQLMRYDSARHAVLDFFALHRALLSPRAIEERPPLSAAARRPGWVGCTIHLEKLPEGALVPMVRGGIPRPFPAIRWDWQRFAPLAQLHPRERSWVSDVLGCVQEIPGGAFTLAQVYAFEARLSAAHPTNAHVRPKIRQQLQSLVRLGILRRVAPGLYTRT